LCIAEYPKQLTSVNISQALECKLLKSCRHALSPPATIGNRGVYRDDRAKRDAGAGNGAIPNDPPVGHAAARCLRFGNAVAGRMS
jgi:hypothetical protein